MTGTTTKPLYLAGKMTGKPQYNFPAFDTAAAHLRYLGFDIQSPAELDDDETREAALASPDGSPHSGTTNGETWGDFLARDVKLISDECGGVVFLDDEWTDSRGARLEAFVNLLCGGEFYMYRPDGDTADTALEPLTAVKVHFALTDATAPEPGSSPPLLIGLNGPAHAGKDTAFGYIAARAEKVGRSAERDAFADRLKISAARALGWTGGDEGAVAFCNWLKEKGTVGVQNASGKRHPHLPAITGREFLQRYGTESHREVFDPDFWIKAVLPDPAEEFAGREWYDILVLTDVRFPNEAEWVRAAGGEVWEIERAGSGAGNHLSEQALPPELVDRTIVNDGTLEEFEERIVECLGAAGV